MNKVFSALKDNNIRNKNCFENKLRIILKDRRLANIHPEELVHLGLHCEERTDALLLFSLAAYIRKDYLPALFQRALVYYDFENYDLALLDIQHCRDLDLDNPEYEKWENLLNSLVHAADESGC